MLKTLARSLWWENALRYTIMAGLLAMIAFVGWQLAQVARSDSSTAVTISTSSASSAGSANTTTATDATAVAAKVAAQHLFGSVVQHHAHLTLQQTNQATEIKQLKLHGVIVSSDPDGTRAILAVNGKEYIYRVGEQLANGDKLVNIQPDRVILNSHGRRYSVVLLKKLARPNNDTQKQAAHLSERQPPLHYAAATHSTLQRLQVMRTSMLHQMEQ